MCFNPPLYVCSSFQARGSILRLHLKVDYKSQYPIDFIWARVATLGYTTNNNCHSMTLAIGVAPIMHLRTCVIKKAKLQGRSPNVVYQKELLLKGRICSLWEQNLSSLSKPVSIFQILICLICRLVLSL